MHPALRSRPTLKRPQPRSFLAQEQSTRVTFKLRCSPDDPSGEGHQLSDPRLGRPGTEEPPQVASGWPVRSDYRMWISPRPRGGPSSPGKWREAQGGRSPRTLQAPGCGLLGVRAARGRAPSAQHPPAPRPGPRTRYTALEGETPRSRPPPNLCPQPSITGTLTPPGLASSTQTCLNSRLRGVLSLTPGV